jgi:hypothetical protein
MVKIVDFVLLILLAAKELNNHNLKAELWNKLSILMLHSQHLKPFS